MSLYKSMQETDLRDLIDEIEEKRKENLRNYKTCKEDKELKSYIVGIDKGYEKVIKMIEERIKR